MQRVIAHRESAELRAAITEQTSGLTRRWSRRAQRTSRWTTSRSARCAAGCAGRADDDVSAAERPYAGIVSRTVALAIRRGVLTIGFAIGSGVLGLISRSSGRGGQLAARCSAPPRCGASW